jgi:hypothetical protein
VKTILCFLFLAAELSFVRAADARAGAVVEVAPPVTPRALGRPLEGTPTSSLTRGLAMSLAKELAALIPGGRVGPIASGGRMWPALDANTIVVYQVCRMDELADNDLIIFDDFRGTIGVSRLVFHDQTYAIVRPDNVRGPVTATRIIPTQIKGRIVAQFQCAIPPAEGVAR